MIGFYFAVQSGGDFEVDYTVMDPDDKVLLEGVNERQGDYIFTANKVCPHASGSAVPGWSKVWGEGVRAHDRLENTVSVSRMKLPFPINY